MPILQVQNVSKSFDGKVAVRDVSFSVEKGEIVCLLGPSGCGKTTLLRIVAGLETPDTGQVLFEGKDVAPVPPYARDFGLMFQDYALFPHKNVYDNVAFGLRGKRRKGDGSQPDLAQRVRSVLALVGMQAFEERSVSDLSGGEAQRVALARSLAPRPSLLMLDEPLGSLDRAMRERLMVELRDILTEVGVTALYVTHDQSEAFSIADRAVIMNEGLVEQIAPPEDIYRRPACAFVASFLGMRNLAQGTIRRPGEMDSEWGVLEADTGRNEPGAAVTVLIRSEAARLVDAQDLEACPQENEGLTALRGRLLRRSFRGGHYQVSIKPEQGPILTFELDGVEPLPVEVGDAMSVAVDPAGIVLWPAGLD